MSHRPEVPSPCQGPGCSAASLLQLVPAPAGHHLCGSSVVQGLWPDGGTAPAPHWRNNERRSEKASEKPVKLPNTSFPWAYHGGLEGRAGGCDSCRFSLGSGSRRDPIVCATSWNTDLSRLSQSEGSLGGGNRFVFCLCPDLDQACTTTIYTSGSHLFAGRASR